MTNSPGKPGPNAAASSGSPAERPSEGFPRSKRLRSRTDFDELFQKGHVVVDHVLVIHGRPAVGVGRVGISISKRVGNAPCRNRWKRLIRESYRRLAARSPELGRLDLVIRPRRGAVAQYAAIERSLASLAARLARQLSRRERS